MSRKDRMREELDDRTMNSDRRTAQSKGELDVSEMDSEDMAELRDEDITNLNENELDRFEAEVGIARGTGETREDLIPERALHKDLERERDEVENELRALDKFQDRKSRSRQ
jgi:hypothetical protein